jgi:two-component system sensor histidine kinase DctS
VEEQSRISQERLQATARLATAGEMASMLSHELNQPLAAISSYATGTSNMLQGAALPLTADLLIAMRRISEQAERAGKIIKSVHDFVRRRDQARESVAPQALLDDIMPLIHLQAHKLSVQVQTTLDAALPPVLCDRTMVEQVLLNLARNAMQAMDQHDSSERLLLIGVQQLASNPAWLEFSISDQGPGISPEVARQLFTPFFTTKLEGMGLGLSLCRTVVEQHGGQLAFEPNHPRGTRFTFTLPVAGPPWHSVGSAPGEREASQTVSDPMASSSEPTT